MVRYQLLGLCGVDEYPMEKTYIYIYIRINDYQLHESRNCSYF